MNQFTHCRCGANALERHNGKLYRKRECPNANDGKPFVYHDLVAQQVNATWALGPNWTVSPEGNQFRGYAGTDPSPMLFDTEDAAWAELDQIYWGHKSWPEDEEDSNDT